MLVAGTGYPGATWPSEFLRPLLTRHAVLTFDHRGTGATPASPERYSTRLFAQDALGLMDALRLPAAHVLGHSMGGRVAQWMALDRPERLRTLILAASGPGQFRDDRPVTRGIPVHAAKEMIELGYERYMRQHIRDTFFTPEFAAAHPDRVAWLHDTFWAHRPDLENYLRHVLARQEHQTADRLSEIRMPTLVMIGERDTDRFAHRTVRVPDGASAEREAVCHRGRRARLLLAATRAHGGHRSRLDDRPLTTRNAPGNGATV